MSSVAPEAKLNADEVAAEMEDSIDYVSAKNRYSKCVLRGCVVRMMIL